MPTFAKLSHRRGKRQDQTFRPSSPAFREQLTDAITIQFTSDDRSELLMVTLMMTDLRRLMSIMQGADPGLVNLSIDC